MKRDFIGNVLRSVQGAFDDALFNLEGTGKIVPKEGNTLRGVSSAGRAPALQAGGHRFDPGTLHQRSA